LPILSDNCDSRRKVSQQLLRIKDLASHDIDSTAWVARSKYTSVSARTAHKSGRVYEDMVAAICDLENGLIVNHLVNWLTPFKERLTIVNDSYTINSFNNFNINIEH
jgi:predicted dehydrogenase